MLTPDQEKWIAHLSDQDQVVILPFDPSTPQKFEVVKRKIQAVLGRDTRVDHRGATNLGISGQDEIDIYIPIPEERFDGLIDPLSVAFGSPRSHYPHERARFVTYEAGKHVDIFLINADSLGWLNALSSRITSNLTRKPWTGTGCSKKPAMASARAPTTAEKSSLSTIF